jgi:hypothetical protein
MVALDAPPRGKATDLGTPLQHIAQMLTRRGMIVLISDLLTSIEQLERNLGYLRAGGHDIVLFHVLDPAELNFDFDAPALFQDVETGRDLYVDPPAAAKGYRHKLGNHLDSASTICGRLGIDYNLFATDRPFDAALLEFLQHRMRIRKQIRHIRAPGGRRAI